MYKMENISIDTGIEVRNKRETNFPKFEKPHTIGHFSLTSGRIYQTDASQLRYYIPPSPEAFPLNLNIGMENVIRKSESAYLERLDFLLTYIYDNFANLSGQQSELQSQVKLQAGFVCFRGLLRMIMCSPYEYRDDWCILVTHFKGTQYLCQLETEKQKLNRRNETKRGMIMSSWGFKMEQYVLSDAPDKPPTVDEPVDETAEFCCMFNTKINDLNILYGAEMDGIINTVPVEKYRSKLNNVKFIEIKTRKDVLNPGQQRTYKQHKTRQWWCQCFLVGIQDVFVGMRDDYGMVNSIEHVTMSSLCKEGQNFWKPSICANFLVEFLSHVRRQTSSINCPYTTHIYYFNASSGRITHRCVRGKTEYSFLPDWYIDLFTTSSARQNI